MTYIFVIIFPAIAMIAGAVGILSLGNFVGEIRNDFHGKPEE